MRSLAAALALAAFAPLPAGAQGLGATSVRVFFSSKSVIEGAQEVPPVETTALGNAVIGFDAARRNILVRVTFTGLADDFTRLHLHCAPAGVNGPVALGIVDLVAIGADNSEDATLGASTVIGELDEDNFFADGGACGISDPRDLFGQIQEGNIYWNLHTFAFPGGELRGQVEPLSRAR